jgi:hypothetical protein
MLIPVVGVDLAADDDVALILNAHDGRGLVVGVGLLVDVVRGAEVERLDAELAGKRRSVSLTCRSSCCGEISLMSGWV